MKEERQDCPAQAKPAAVGLVPIWEHFLLRAAVFPFLRPTVVRRLKSSSFASPKSSSCCGSAHPLRRQRSVSNSQTFTSAQNISRAEVHYATKSFFPPCIASAKSCSHSYQPCDAEIVHPHAALAAGCRFALQHSGQSRGYPYHRTRGDHHAHRWTAHDPSFGFGLRFRSLRHG